MYNPFSLAGKTILVTGASSGIGRTTAMECSKMGATLVLSGRDKVRLEDTFSSLEGRGHHMFLGDLTKENILGILTTEIPMLEGVFFCAGVSDTTLTKFLDKEKIDRVFDINVYSPMLLTKLLLKAKKIKSGASLVYMGSMGAEEVTKGLGIYAASKSALHSFMKAVANELICRKIRANSIMPMMIQTNLIDTLESLSQEEIERDKAKYPLGYGAPEDVAYAAIFLLSDASRWITGCSIRMDGGSTLS